MKNNKLFRDWYSFCNGISKRNVDSKLDFVYKQIRNAVPVRLDFVVLEPIAGFEKNVRKRKENLTTFLKDDIILSNVIKRKHFIHEKRGYSRSLFFVAYSFFINPILTNNVRYNIYK